MSHLLLDKPRIAQEALGNLRGLRELGNPHIAPGLLLRSMKEDPQRVQVDRAALREAQIRIIERRGASGSLLDGESENEGRASPAAVAAQKRPVHDDEAPGNSKWLCLALVATVLFSVLVYVRTR